jgi:hypothetical protein
MEEASAVPSSRAFQQKFARSADPPCHTVPTPPCTTTSPWLNSPLLFNGVLPRALRQSKYGISHGQSRDMSAEDGKLRNNDLVRKQSSFVMRIHPGP